MPETKITIIKNNVSVWHLIAGIIMAITGIYVWFNPAVTLVALALYLGIVFIVVGAGYFLASFSFQSGWYLLVGLLDIFVGVIFVSNLGVTAASMPIIFALWCLAVGIIQLVASFQFKKSTLPWTWSLTVGALGVIFAFIILAYPAVGTFTLTALMGAYILIYGIVEIAEYITNRKLITMG